MIHDDERRRINQAVADAEARTAAEIVPVMAPASGRYDRAEDIAGLWLGITGLTAVWFLYPHPAADPGSWEDAASTVGLLPALVAALLAGFVAGAVLASRVGWLRRLFTSTRQMQEEVAGRARAAFVDSRVHHTAAGTGILLYVSLFERMAHVLADQAVQDQLGPAGIQDLCNSLVERLGRDGPAAALEQTIRDCGDRLAGPLPRSANASNQLPDALICLE